MALAGTKVGTKTHAETREALKTLSMVNQVRLIWIRAHVGHLGNEAADEAAKKGSKSSRGNFQAYASRCTVWREISDRIDDEWRARWLARDDQRQSHLFIEGPDYVRSRQLMQLSRDAVGKLVHFFFADQCKINSS